MKRLQYALNQASGKVNRRLNEKHSLNPIELFFLLNRKVDEKREHKEGPSAIHQKRPPPM